MHSPQKSLLQKLHLKIGRSRRFSISSSFISSRTTGFSMPASLLPAAPPAPLTGTTHNLAFFASFRVSWIL